MNLIPVQKAVSIDISDHETLKFIVTRWFESNRMNSIEVIYSNSNSHQIDTMGSTTAVPVNVGCLLRRLDNSFITNINVDDIINELEIGGLI